LHFWQTQRVAIGFQRVTGWAAWPFQWEPSRTWAGRQRFSVIPLVQNSLRPLSRFVPGTNPVWTRGFIPLGRGM